MYISVLLDLKHTEMIHWPKQHKERYKETTPDDNLKQQEPVKRTGNT